MATTPSPAWFRIIRNIVLVLICLATLVFTAFAGYRARISSVSAPAYLQITIAQGLK